MRLPTSQRWFTEGSSKILLVMMQRNDHKNKIKSKYFLLQTRMAHYPCQTEEKSCCRGYKVFKLKTQS